MMADEYVRTEHFGEFVKRMDERFDHVNELADQRFDSINQRFLDVEKRFDSIDRGLSDIRSDMNRGLSDMRADMRQMRNWQISLYVFIALGFLGMLAREFLFN